MRRKVLVIDDDSGLRTLLKMSLERDGFEVVTASSGEEGLRQAYTAHPDAVILDVMMPKMDGWATCQRLRQVCDVPIVMLTAKSETQDVIKGLTLGADDYLLKPFRLEELKVRLRKAMQRGTPGTGKHTATAYDDGRLHIDPTKGMVTREGHPVELTPTESRLLNYLVTYRGRIVPHEELLGHVWGPQYSDEVKYLSVYIRYLRQKIETDPANPEYILTKHRVGYCFRGQAVMAF